MASRRDQLQSYQFLTQRVISAFVMRETDPAQSPLRRGIGALFAGIMVAVVVGAGFGVYGLLTKVGGDTWKTNGAVVIEKETGAPFVYQNGELHPMLNYASALLATGSSSRQVFQESAGELQGVPRGVLLGIPYAPDSVPDASHTLAGPWTLCTTGVQNGGEPDTTLALSATPSGADALGDHGLVVTDPDTQLTYLVWHGSRYRISAPILALLYGAVTPLPVGTAWLNGLPTGADIIDIQVDGAGSTSPAAPHYKVGQVLVTHVATGGLQYWLVFPDGLAPITQLQKDIVAQGQGSATSISATEASSLPHSSHLGAGGGIAQPSQPPALDKTVGANDPLCAVYRGATGTPTLFTGGTMPSAAATATAGHTAGGAALADHVLVPSGHAAVRSPPQPTTAAGGGYYLVTDLGIRYAVASASVLGMLGYTDGDAVAMPATLVDLIPDGPALDPSAAAAPATGATSPN